MNPADETVIDQPGELNLHEGVEVDAAPVVEPEKPETPAEATEDDEASQYSKSVQKRIKELTYQRHESERQRDAAVEYARSVIQQNEQLRSQLLAGHKVLAETAFKKTDAELDTAKKRYVEAVNLGDAAAQAEANAEIGRIQAEKQQVQRFAASPPQVPQPQPQFQQAPQLDEGQRKFLSENPWWNRDKGMTAVATAVHQEFAERNPYAVGTDEYYKAITSEVKKRFPEKFEAEAGAVVKSNRGGVAPSSRMGGTKNGKVTLSESQIKVIDRLRGKYSREEFMKRYAKEMEQ